MTQKSGSSADAAGVVLTFLESVGRRSEAELYLKLFRELPKESFAIIIAEAAVIRHAAGSLVEQLRFLRELGLFAPVAVGLFEPMHAEKSATRLAKQGAHMGAVVENALDPNLAAQVREELDAENFPILSFAGAEHETVRDSFQRLGRLAGELGTRKIVVLRRRGGLRRYGRSVLSPNTSLAEVERGISVVNLRTDLEALQEPRTLTAEDGELLGNIGAILSRPDCSRVVAAITSPLSLLHELFTVKGAGTLIKRGTSIDRHASYSTLDRARLVGLFESSFGRNLNGTFFDEAPPRHLSRGRLPSRRRDRAGEARALPHQVRRRSRRTGRRHGSRSLGSGRQGPPIAVLARACRKPDRKLVRSALRRHDQGGKLGRVPSRDRYGERSSSRRRSARPP